MLYKFRGIVLKETKLNDSDKIITIFTKEKGKIQAVAKGVRKPKSKLVSSTQVFCISDFVAYKGKNLYNINQGETISSFYSLREDLKKLAYASYVVELVNSGLAIEEPNNKIFGLLVKTLNLITIYDEYEKIARAFELKLISFLGYRPFLKKCVNCNKDFDKNIKFSINYGGILCNDCISKDPFSKKTSKAVVDIMKYLLYTPFEDILDNDIREDVLIKIENIMLPYLYRYLDRSSFKSLKFIKAVN